MASMVFALTLSDFSASNAQGLIHPAARAKLERHRTVAPYFSLTEMNDRQSERGTRRGKRCVHRFNSAATSPTLGLARRHGPAGPFASQPERRLGRLLTGGSPSRTVGCCAPTDRSRPLCETHCLRRSSASKGSMRMPWTSALKDGTAASEPKSAATTRTRRASASVTAL